MRRSHDKPSQRLTGHRPDRADDGAAKGLRADFRRQPVLNTVLLALSVAAIVLAYTAIGPASQSSGQSTRTTTVKRGVVQSTVSGSGNVRSADELNLGFKTSGTVTHVYINKGQHVTQGQLLATLDPQSAEVTLQQARATLQSAEATLAQEEESKGETGTPAESSTTSAPTKTTGAPVKKTTTSSSTSASSKATAASTKQSAATREANLASARAAVKSDKLTVESNEQAVQNTKLYAPETGTIVSLSGEVGETVSGTGTSKVASTSSSASSSSSSGGKAGSGGATSSTGSASGASASSSSSSSFAVLGNLESLQLVVALSESEIANVHVGQIATVTLEALSGRKLAAHVLSVDQVPTSTSGAVSYGVTFQLDQGASGLKVGMSATAEVVVKQAEGLNVPTSAIKAGAVTVLRNGKQATVPVTTGLAGDSSTIVLGGLAVGEQVVLPSATSKASSSLRGSGSSSRSSSGVGAGGFSGGFPGGGPPGG